MKPSLCTVVVGVIASITAKGAASGGPAQLVDFVYFGDVQAEIEVPFAFGSSCPGSVYVDPHRAVALEKVLFDGRGISSFETRGGYVHDELELILENPGPGFQYRMRLRNLYSSGSGSSSPGVVFRIPARPVPNLLEISYRIRCPGGQAGPLMVTRGRKFALSPRRAYHPRGAPPAAPLDGVRRPRPELETNGD